MKRERYYILDSVRGLIIISMLLYHILWDLSELFGGRFGFGGDCFVLWQKSIRYGFIILSGFCWSLGKHKLKRAITVLVCSAIITAVTAIFMGRDIILFGVLSLLGSAMLITIPLDRLFKKINPHIGLSFSVLLFFLLIDLEHRWISFLGIDIYRLPRTLYRNLFTAYLGMPTASFHSTDYVPLFPWLFLFFAGYYLYHIANKHSLLPRLCSVRIKPLEWLGRHSLIIYMLHQPVIYAILWLIFKAI